jgi:hypothetical protein
VTEAERWNTDAKSSTDPRFAESTGEAPTDSGTGMLDSGVVASSSQAPELGRRSRKASGARQGASGDPDRSQIEPHLSMSPTTKNIDPRIATMSPTTCPGSISESTAMLLNDAERSLSRHGVLSPRDTR